MPLRTVRVPAELEPLFGHAEDLVSRFFARRRDDPSKGTIEVFGERYLLVRGASLSVEFFDRVRGLYGPGREAEADDFARNLLFDLAHAVGRSDARNVHAKMELSDPLSKMSAGPVHFAHAGWAFVDISPRSRPEPNDEFFLEYEHPYSFESDAFVHAGRVTDFPVCVMNAGYSSGWCEESFGLALVATEVECRACGDATCRFLMAPPSRIEERVTAEHARGTPSRHDAIRRPIPDLFARKRSEEVLRRHFEEQLAHHVEAEARIRNAQRLESIGRLAGGIAHDFNNLMAVVIARATRARDRLGAGDPLRQELGYIVDAGERASALTRQLLAFSRAQVLKIEPIDFDRVVEETIALLTPLLGEDIVVERSFGAQGATVLFDRSQLEQVVTNLAVNARDAMPHGGRLEIVTRLVSADQGATGEPEGTRVELALRDDGIGMDEATLARVFDPFFTTKQGRGAGLGLSTVLGVMQQAGGSVNVESREGAGTRFLLRFPVGEGALRTPSDRPGPERAESSTPALCVLMVEDEPAVREVVRLTLEDAGHEVVVFEGPSEALTVDAETLARAAALVSDVVMPGMNGPALCRSLRERRPDLPVLFLSGYSPDTGLLEELPGAAFLMKPFRPRELIAALGRLVAAEES